MYIDEKPALSRTTITSGRILTTFTSGIILAKFYGIESETITILGVTIQAADLSSPAVLIICFMCFGHVINWFSDHFYLLMWNSGESSTTAKNNSRADSLCRQVEAKIKNMKRLKKEEEANEELTKLIKKAENLKKDLRNMSKEEERFKKTAQRLSKQAKFILYGWHGAMPLALATVAYFMLFLDIP